MSIRVRGRSLYYDFKNAAGKRKQPASGFVMGQEKEAEKALQIILRAIEAERELRKAGEVPEELPAKGVTVGMLGRHWLKDRQQKKPQAAKEDAWKLREHIYPALEHVKLDELRTRHVRDFVWALRLAKDEKGNPRLASRSVRAIWSTCRTMLRDAVADGFLAQDVCVLKHGDLPPVEDADPEWRDTALFSREEVEQLISDDRIPLPRRALYAILFLAGLRPSEAFALRLKQYDATKEPLGRLDLFKAYNSNLKEEKGLKVAGKRRLIPVHPTLARVLAHWLLSGWEAHVGRKHSPEDLLVPTGNGTHQDVKDTYQAMLADQAMLGWRKRRQYDSRRTFISLAQDDGADKEKLKWVTHGPKANDIMDLYTSRGWASICAEVVKLRVELRSGILVELRRASGSDLRDSQRDSSGDGGEMLSEIRADTRIRTGDLLITKEFSRGELRGRLRTTAQDAEGLGVSPTLPHPSTSGPPVTLSREPDWPFIRAALRILQDDADQENSAGLRTRLQALLASLPSPEGGR